jgi:AmmeMemoRadiSam system radical SAM enzyme
MAETELSLERVLDTLTVRGELYTPRADGALTCYACGHRCLIKPGRRGICQVRFNDGGELRVPWGYVGALQCDPTEKKPFFHVYPGSDTLTFGMLGCDLHCSYCFPPETIVVTDSGARTLAEIFAAGSHTVPIADGEATRPPGLRVMTASGQWRPIVQAFQHHFAGNLTVIRPNYLPELRCTPGHQIYATLDPGRRPEKMPAAELTRKHYLAIPRRFATRRELRMIDTSEALSQRQTRYKVPRQLTAASVEYILSASGAGQTSRELGLELGKHPSYIRHVRSKVARGLWNEHRIAGVRVEAEHVRFPNEHRPGIPLKIPLDPDFARLLGYYCAEGSVNKGHGRPNSYSLVFSFGPHETELAAETQRLIQTTLGLKSELRPRLTTLTVTVNKTSAALLFDGLCGVGSAHKRVPAELFDSPLSVVQAFLDAYQRGDGHRYANGKVHTTTKSRTLAYGVAWLVLRAGYLPSVYENQVGVERIIVGRTVHQSPQQYSVVWYGGDPILRKAVTTADYYLVPLRAVGTAPYVGPVYNLEVEDEHNYLANLTLVSNCQNWVTSQALRDPASAASGAQPQLVTAEQLVTLARQRGAQLVGSSYNEPLITSEWAVAVFQQAIAAGLKCVYISNGNATPEVLDYIRPYVSAYKVDLKTMSDKNYRRLGAVLQNVLDTLQQVHKLGIWLEVVTLVIPGFNDSPAELTDAARFLASLSPDIPWHVTAFHPDYKMTGPDATRAAALRQAAEIGRAAGLRYVYAGNLPGQVGDLEHTFCPTCRHRLVARSGYRILEYTLTAEGACPQCGTRPAGLWTDTPASVRLHGPGAPRAVSGTTNRFRSDIAR